MQRGSTVPQVVSTAAAPVATSLADPPSNAPYPGDHPTPDQSVYNSKSEDHQRSQTTPHTSVSVDATHPSPFEPTGSSPGNKVTVSGTILSFDAGGTEIVVGASIMSNFKAAASRGYTAIGSLSAGNKSETGTIVNATITSGFVGRASESATVNSTASSSHPQNPIETSAAGRHRIFDARILVLWLYFLGCVYCC